MSGTNSTYPLREARYQLHISPGTNPATTPAGRGKLAQVRGVFQSLLNATIEVYGEHDARLLPTAVKLFEMSMRLNNLEAANVQQQVRRGGKWRGWYRLYCETGLMPLIRGAADSTTRRVFCAAKDGGRVSVYGCAAVVCGAMLPFFAVWY